MKWFERKVPFYRKKSFFIPVGLFLIVAALWLTLPVTLKAFLNHKLDDKELSPTLKAHVGHVDLDLIWGRVQLRNVTASIRETGEEFLKVEALKMGLSWSDVLELDLGTDVLIQRADLTYSDSLIKALKAHAEAKKKEVRPLKAPPVRVARVDIRDSLLRVRPYDELTGPGDVLISEIGGRITNLTPDKKSGKTYMILQGTVLESGHFKTVGEAKLLEKPIKWSVDSELLKFDLSSLNRFLLDRVPITFTNGRLDLYAEAQSAGEGRVKGYLKPFVKELDVVKKKEDFKGPRHFLLEIIAAISNMTVEADEVSATKVPFVFDGELKAETGEALMNAFEHGFQEELARGIENSLNLR